MSDNASLRIWQALQPMIRKEITKGTESSVKSKKMVVTTAYNTTTRTVGVTEAFGSEIQVPVAGGVNPNSLTVGRAVWVIALHGSWSNAMVCMLGDGTNGYDPNDYITKSDLNAEKTARKNADDVLSARMDAFTALPNGSTTGDAELMDIRVGVDGNTYASAGAAVRGQISAVKDELDQVIVYAENLYKDGDVTLTGTSQWEHKDVTVDVSSVSDKPITVSMESVEGCEHVEYCIVQFRDSDGNLLIPNTSFNENRLSVTYENHNTHSVFIQMYRSYGFTPTTEATVFHGISVIAGETESYIKKEYLEKPVEEIVAPMISQIGNPKGNILASSLESMTGGDTIVLNAPDVKKGKTISFTCNITEMGAVRISHCDSFSYCSGVIEVTIDKVNYYDYGTELALSKSVDHGLTVQDYMAIIVSCSSDKLGGDDACKVTIITSTGNFTAELPFGGSRENVKANAVSGSYANCVLSFFCGDYKKDVWAFGDSYFDMWPAKAISLGYNNLLIDGWSGRASKEAYESLEKLLELYPAPKKILWCMGMNDGDSSTEVNENWNTYYNRIKELCADRCIELILTTIPNIPDKNHSFKNNIIRNSGLRYVDVCKAVGAESDSSWYSGLLGDDQAHPSEIGGYVIASAIIASVPEIGN